MCPNDPALATFGGAAGDLFSPGSPSPTFASNVDVRIWLLLSTAIFAGFLLFRMRPSLSGRRGQSAIRAALRDAQDRAAKSTTPRERARALADAGDACARSIARTNGAVGFYLRAMRTDPASEELVTRAAAALHRRPRALESLLWRRLGADTFSAERKPAALAALRALAQLYAAGNGSVRSRSRARAIEHVLLAMGEIVPLRTPSLADA